MQFIGYKHEEPWRKQNPRVSDGRSLHVDSDFPLDLERRFLHILFSLVAPCLVHLSVLSDKQKSYICYSFSVQIPVDETILLNISYFVSLTSTGKRKESFSFFLILEKLNKLLHNILIYRTQFANCFLQNKDKYSWESILVSIPCSVPIQFCFQEQKKVDWGKAYYCSPP